MGRGFQRHEWNPEFEKRRLARAPPARTRRYRAGYRRSGRPSCGDPLATLAHELDVRVRRVAVHEVAEALEDRGRLDRFLPLALVAVDELLHVGFQLRADPQCVFAHHLAHIVDASLEVLQPGAGALQAIAGADVEHEEAIDGAD